MCGSGTAEQPRGIALIVVMLVMAVLLLAGTTFLTISSTESQIAGNELAAAQAFALAEAAIERAIVRLNADAGYTGTADGDVPLGTGRFRAAVAVSATQPCPGSPARDVVGTGAVSVRGGEARVQLQATLDRVSYVFRWAAFATVANGIVGGARIDQEVLLGPNSRVDSFSSLAGPFNAVPPATSSDPALNQGRLGDLGANGDVWISGGSTVAGSVRAGDQVIASGASVTGAVVARLPASRQSRFPWLAPPAAAAAPPAISGAYQLAAGTYVWNGLTLPADTVLTTAGPVTLYVTGPVTIGDNVRLGGHPATQLKLFLKSDAADGEAIGFSAGRDFTLYGGLYGRNADVVIGDRAQIHGSLVARTIALGGASTLHYDQALEHHGVCNGDGSTGTSTSGRYVVRRGTWREILP